VAELRYTPAARADLKRIWRYIALDNPPAATALLLKIERRLEYLATFPAAGTPRPELDPACRLVVVAGYRVLYAYRAEPEQVDVVAVVEPYRELPSGFTLENA
jgi:toxin ParE1/3/4